MEKYIYDKNNGLCMNREKCIPLRRIPQAQKTGKKQQGKYNGYSETKFQFVVKKTRDRTHQSRADGAAHISRDGHQGKQRCAACREQLCAQT